ncbi:MAG: hypothetical protein RL391_218 [Actinomycetota bacterium]
MRIVIAGAGSVGRYMAGQLSKAGHDVTIVDNDPDALGRDEAQLWKRVLGDACEVDVLSRAGCATAEVVAAVTGDDEDNLVISLLAKQEFGAPRVVARVNNPNNEWMYNEMWGVDVSVSTPHLLTALVEEAVNVGSFVRILSFEHGRAQLAEVTLASSSPAVGRPIGEIGLPRESVVVAVVRDGHVVHPSDDLRLRDADEVLVLVVGESEAQVKSILVGATEVE